MEIVEVVLSDQALRRRAGYQPFSTGATRVDTVGRNITVVGAGFMGTVIATLYARYGYRVRITDVASEALKTFRERAKPIAASLVDNGLEPDAILANDDTLDLWIRQTVGTARHVSGTCKMGPDSDPMAVVDQYCRVKGVQGLWVVDASVMPRIPRSGGAHATVIMIAERCVDWVAGRVPAAHG